jgi:tetratricopeptide (TPR) repeat protein
MSTALVLDAPTERVAVNLLRHFEWQDEGFSLIFLFADVGPSLQLASWLDQRLVTLGRPLQRLEAKDSFVREPEAAVDALVAQFAELSAQPGGVWFAAQRHPGDAQWNRARTLFLARLNERRFLLERDLHRPLVLVFPAHFRPEARSIAPDIWHKRDLSEELRAAPAPVVNDAVREVALPAPAPATGNMDTPAFDEWTRVSSGASTEQANLPTAWRASEELLAAGRPGDAELVALSALSLARRRADKTTDLSSRRDLSMSLDNVGQVAEAQGDWSQAASVYRESLTLTRQLVERLGGTPEALRDLSVSLDNVGQVARAQGDWSQAESVYRESLALRRQLVERLGGTPEALRDLSVSLDNVGQVAQAQGDWSQAESVYRESLALARQLVERLGGTPEALDDLAASLINVASLPAGDAAARAEARGIYQQLAARIPDVARYTEQLRTLSGDNADPEPDATNLTT